MTTPASISVVRDEAGRYSVSHNGEPRRVLLKTGPHAWVLGEPGRSIDVANPGSQFRSKTDALRALAAGDLERGAAGTEACAAGDLGAGELGALVTFRAVLDAGVRATVTGELRQVYHTGNDTTINVCSPDRDVAGELAEFTLAHDDVLEVQV